MNTRLILIISAVIIGLLAIAAIPTVINLNHGTLSLTVIPNDSVVKIDNGGAQAGNTGLAPGNHTVSLSRDGFSSQNFTVTIKSGQTVSKDVVLTSNSAVGNDWIGSHPDQAALAEGIAGKQSKDAGAIAAANNKIIELLPYVGADFKLDYGASRLHPNDPAAVAIYITASTTAGQTKANRWIESQGYTPTDFEIIYQGLSDGG